MRPKTWRVLIYGGLAIVFAASYVLAATYPAGDIVRTIAGSVSVGALIGALLQLYRDEAAYERLLNLRRDDQQFQVGVTSHMSNVVFDKHVEFCEEYMEEVRATVDELIRSHASQAAVAHANKLFEIRRRHATWVTTAMSQKLSQFEDAVRKLGAAAGFVADTTGNPQYAEQRAQAVEYVFKEFQRILPQLFGKESEDGIGSESIEARVREMLGIELLVDLRAKLIARAHKSLPPPY